jgi:transcriptional regulator with XRE-family HTH domain
MSSHRFVGIMLINISSPQTLGLLIRASRKHQKIRMDDVAGSAGVGPVFVREVERGKETVQLGRVLKLLSELGIELKADVPDDVVPAFVALRLTGVKPLKPRRPASKAASVGAGGNDNNSADELK